MTPLQGEAQGPDPLDRGGSHGLAYELVARVLEEVRNGTLQPGDKLPTEASLASSYGVSRTVVREAISRLQASGLVETRQGRGSVILPQPVRTPFEVSLEEVRSVEDMVELIEFRTAIEVESAGLAALRASGVELGVMGRSLKDFEASHDAPSRSVAADFRFHLSIAEASRNRHLSELLGTLGQAMIALPRTRLVGGQDASAKRHFDRVCAEHEAIFQAVSRRDVAAAQAAARIHLFNSIQRLRQQQQS